MGYIIAIIAILIVIPLLMMLTRRPSSSGLQSRATRDTARSEPASDQPTPPAGPQTDQPHRGSDRGVPPG
jgi:hypothetical protein